MGNKRGMICVMELYANTNKSVLLKVYEFCTITEIAYVLDMKPSTVSNFYHKLIKAKDKLRYVNIYQKKIVT